MSGEEDMVSEGGALGRDGDWVVTMRLDRHDVSTLRFVLDDPPHNSNLIAVERLSERLGRIWDRKENG